MKAMILAGGRGTRIAEETGVRPKPMVEIGGRPILWHILKGLSHFGITEFVVCLGYKGYLVKEYFANYLLHASDVTVDLARGELEWHHRSAEPWRVTLVDTGETTMTGGRVRRALPHVAGDERFLLTYGDGLADVDVGRLVRFHDAHDTLGTVTAVQPPGRFGAVALEGDRVRGFVEKPQGDGGWVSGGFFVLSPRIEPYLGGDDVAWEAEPLERLAADGELTAFRHPGFFQPMDTVRDQHILEDLWRSGRAPWAVWRD